MREIHRSCPFHDFLSVDQMQESAHICNMDTYLEFIFGDLLDRKCVIKICGSEGIDCEHHI